MAMNDPLKFWDSECGRREIMRWEGDEEKDREKKRREGEQKR